MDRIDITVVLWAVPIGTAIYAITAIFRSIINNRDVYSRLLNGCAIALLFYFIRLEIDDINHKIFELSVYSGAIYFDKWKIYDFLVIIYFVAATKTIQILLKEDCKEKESHKILDTILESDSKFNSVLIFLSFLLLLIILSSPVGSNFHEFIHDLSEIFRHSNKWK